MVVYVGASAIIGVYANKYITRLSDFLVAGRSLRVYLGIATMTGTEIGLVSLMYAAHNGYKNGPSSVHIAVIAGLAMVFFGVTGFIVYRLRASGVMTIPEYYGKRFNVPVRWVGGLILAGAGILNMGLFLRAGADFVTGVTGLASNTWLLIIMTTLMGLVLLYTILGGMVSIIITDLIQFIVLSVGMLLVTGYAISHIGWENIFRITTETKGSASVNPFSEEGGYGLMYVISMLILNLSAAGLWQSGTLRALSARSPRTAKMIYGWTSIGIFARFAIPAFWGMCAFAFLHLPENAGLAAQFATTDEAAAELGLLKPIQAMPVMVGQIVPSIILGVVVAAMLAGFMSTHDSYLLCWSSVLCQDVVAPLVPGGMSDRARIWLTRVFVFLQGMFLLYWGLWYPAPENLWDYMATTGTVYLSGCSAVVVGGLYWRRASSAGAMASLLVGLLAVAPILKHKLPDGFLTDGSFLYRIVYEEDLTRVITFVASWAAMIVFSLLWPDRKKPEPTSVTQGVSS